MKTDIKVSICIPAYNAEKTISDSIISAASQSYTKKEILVWDDGSTDNTAEIAEKFGIRVIRGEKNQGIGITLKRLMDEARGKYVVYLCSDDLFANDYVVKDIVKQFDNGDPGLGIIGRSYYEFMDNPSNIVGIFRDRNILTSSVNPSGMAFKRMEINGTNDVFVEMPYIVKQYLEKYRWTMFPYESIAVRIHPGGNTGTKKEYYTGSAVENWHNIIGIQVKYYQQFIQLRARSTFKMLIREVMSNLRINKWCWKEARFWLYLIPAIFIPGFVLRICSKLYRLYISKHIIDDVIRRVEA